MQNSMWKMATLLGVIGVGCLVVLQLQKGLPSSQTALAGLQPAGDAVPKPQDESGDPFSFDGFDEAGEAPPSADPFSPSQGQSEPEAPFGEEPLQPAAATSDQFDDLFSSQPDPATEPSTGVTPAGATRVAAVPDAQETPAFGDDLFGEDSASIGAAGTSDSGAVSDPFGAPGTEAGQAAFGLDADSGATLQATPDNVPLDSLEPTPASTVPATDPFGGDNAFGSEPAAQPDLTPAGDGLSDPWAADPVTQPATTNKPPQALPDPKDFGQEGIDDLFAPETPEETGSASTQPTTPAISATSRVDLSPGPTLPKPAPLDDWRDEPSAPALAAPSDQRDPFGQDVTQPAVLPEVQRVPTDPRPLQFERIDDEPTRLTPAPAALRVPETEPAPVPIPQGDPFGADLTPTPAPERVPTRPVSSATPPAERFDGIRPAKASYPAPSLDSVPHGTLKPQLQIAKSAPGTAAIGKPLIYSIKIKNVGNAVADDVVVEDFIPEGARLTGTIPQAELINNRLTWRFARLEPKQEQEIKIRVVPEKEGQIGSVATVRMKTEIGSRTTITAPRLKLELQAQKDAKVGETIVVRYRISNTGSGEATKVVLQHALPAQLQHTMGADLEYDVGTVPAGTTRDVTLQLVAAQAGEAFNTAVVTAEGGMTDRANATVSVMGAQLKVTRRGPARRYLNRTAVYENTVANTTHRDSDPATLIEYVPEGMEYVDSNGGQYSPIKRTVAWSVPAIRSGDKLKFQVQLKPISAGSHESLVQVVEQTGFKSNAKSRTQVVNLHNMGLDLSQLDGPLEVGEKVVFTIDVRNRGTSAATNSVLEVQVPRELRVLEAGPVEAKFVENNVARFEPVPEIRASGQKRFQIVLIAEQAAQDVRLRATIRSDQMPQRLLKEESITVFEDEGN